MPNTALNTTTENVLNLSNRPNTAFGSKDVPIGPMIIAARQTTAHTRSDLICSFFVPTAISTKDANENTTTNTVTARCMMFCGLDADAPLTHGKR